MKKIIYKKFGNEQVLEMVETQIPVIDDTTLLVKVKAVGVNPLDWKVREGKMKLMSGSKFPKEVGIDFSGVVEKTGVKVASFNKGDEVFGLTDVFAGGALAEYIVVHQDQLALKPKEISFEQAAALSVTGSAAIQIIENLIQVQKGTEVLVNGATGGIGMFLVQMLKEKGAIVSSVVSTMGIELAKQWKSDYVIDYTRENILMKGKSYDVVVDLSGKMSFSSAKKILKQSSTFINTVPGPIDIISSAIHNLFSNTKYKVLLLKPDPAYLSKVALSVSKGLEVVIGKVYSWKSFKEAYRETPEGKFPGKAILVLS